MFLDLSGFSSMTDTLMTHGQHGAEVLANLMHGVFDPLVEGIFNYGGKIVGFAGDGIMALFPVERDATSTALSALASAWLIQQRLDNDPGRSTIYGTFQFSAKIGLTFGEVSWGILHSSDQSNATYFFRGSAVDDAALAEHQARAGEIIVTEAFCRLLGDHIRTEAFGSFHRVRGFSAEMPVPTPTIFPPVDLPISRIFMPEEIIAQNARGEFRQVVNLFMRLPDLTNEELQDVTRIIFDLRKKYGGLLNRIDFGDKGCNILMLWGAPVAYENDISLALNFILDLQERVDFPVTAGVTYYVAHAGYLGSVMCEDYTCYGWGVNLASRFMMGAPQGEIWVDDRIARRVTNRFEIEYVGEQRFKGFSALQVVHRLKRYHQNVESVYQGEIIGRERELTQLEKFIDPVWRGDFAGTLLVLGDAGIGKGRLVQAFRYARLFEDNNALWAFCQSEQILRESFNPFCSWLFHYFGFTTIQDTSARKQIFDSKLDELIASIPDAEPVHELNRLRSVLGAMVDLFWEGSLYEELDAEGRYNNTLLVLTSLIKAESLRQPLILFVEDVQFIDEDSLNFLPRLKRSLVASDVPYPVAVFVTSRIESHNPVLDSDLVDEQIHLGGLRREAVARLVEILLGGVPSLELVNLVMDRSEGNPYFVEQIIHYLQEENLIEMSASGWRQVQRIRESFLPGDIGALLVARLDQLSRRVKEVVQTASVFGREFMLEVLSAMTAEGDAIEQYVIDAEQSAIWLGDRDGRYIFTHGLLRDAAYTMQMRARRLELHMQAVRALEKIYADELKFHYAELGYHSERAELWEKTQQYYSLAGKTASDAYQNLKGIDYFTRALSFTKTHDLPAKFDLLVDRVELYARRGDHVAHLKDLQTLEDLAHNLDDPQREAFVEMQYARYFVVSADYPAVIQHAESVVALSRTFNQPEVVLKTYQVWPLALLRMGKLEEAMRVAWEGRRRAQEYGDLNHEGYILMTMGLIATEQKDAMIADEYYQQALVIARQTSDRKLEARLLGNLGSSAGFILQDYALAREYYEKAYAIHHQWGELSKETVALSNLAWVIGMQGDFETALSYYARVLPLSREIGNLYNEISSLINLSAISGMRDDAQSALDYSQKALELSRNTNDLSNEAWSFLYMGYAYLLHNDLVRARDAFIASINLRNELGQPGLKTEPQAGLVQVYLAGGDVGLALTEAENILSYLPTSNALYGTEEPLRVYYACYLVLEKAKDPRSSSILQSAVQLLETQVSKLRDDRSRKMFIENVPWRLALRKAYDELQG